MKPYPLGLDNPYKIMQQIGSTKWSIYRKEPFQKIATFRTEHEAYEARRALIEFEGNK